MKGPFTASTRGNRRYTGVSARDAFVSAVCAPVSAIQVTCPNLKSQAWPLTSGPARS